MATISHNESVLTDIKDDIDKVIHKVGVECLSRVSERTPVKTGYARSRWVLTENKEGFNLSNDADYISFLELGSSEQAPTGMLGITMLEVPHITDEVVHKLRRR